MFQRIHPLPGLVARRLRGAAWLPVCALVMLAGCSAPGMPNLKPPLPDAWHNLPADAAPASADLNGWWQALGDPALNALIARALQNNLDVQQAAERLKAARILNRHGQDDYLPNLHARTNDVIDPDASASFFIGGFDAMWELPLFGALKSSARLAQSQEDSARIALRGARVSLAAEVARQWIELRTAQRQQQLLEGVRDAQQRQWQLMQARTQWRLSAPVEAAHAQAAFHDAEAALIEPRQAVLHAAQQLAVLLGQPEPDAAWLQPGPQPQLGTWQLTRAPADLLRTRPEIGAAEADVIHALGEYGMSRADIYPHLGIGASLQWSTDIASYRRTISRGIFSIGPVLDIPLFDWGQRVAAAHVKGHQLNAAVLAYRQAVLNGVAEVEMAMGDLQLLRERQQASERAVQAQQQGDQAVQTRLALRMANQLDVQQSAIETQRAQLELTQAIAARDLAYVALYKALGGAPLPDAAGGDAPATPNSTMGMYADDTSQPAATSTSTPPATQP